MWTERRSGHSYQRDEADHRDPYERDATRVIHCPSFRRLQRKTQILGTDEGDFHRTRLTHSLEVASIGQSLVRSLRNQGLTTEWDNLLPSDDLMRVICLLHDIGHPPFGHGGEVALNYMMQHYGGFEGNGQTFRLLTKLENCYGVYGLDLTRRALLGVLKYPVSRSWVVAQKASLSHRVNDWLPPKSYFDCEQPEIDWLFQPFSAEDRALFQTFSPPSTTLHGQALYHSFDCSIMNIADDIAYGVHDLEDAIHLRLIHRNHLDNDAFRQLLQETTLHPELLDRLFAPELASRKHAIGQLVHYLITSIAIQPTNPAFEHAQLKYNLILKAEAQALISYLQNCVYQHVINSQEARTFEFGGQTVVLKLFEALNSNPTHLLDQKNRQFYAEAVDDTEAHRIICDYIANMTDEYAYRMHERLFGFNTRTIFERL